MRSRPIRQPYAEMIPRGIKAVKYRTRPTQTIGERSTLPVDPSKRRGLRRLAASRARCRRVSSSVPHVSARETPPDTSGISRMSAASSGRASPHDGPSRDWIVDCAAQVEVYLLLNEALDASSP